MAKLYFRYGAMNSGKSTALLQAAFNYEERGLRVLLFKPAVDTKSPQVLSRIGVSRDVDVHVDENMNILDEVRESQKASKVSCVIVDEAQFLTPKQIEELFHLAAEEDIPVIAYGLRTDFKTHSFPGSARLLELAHSIEEMKTICRCGRKAIFNARKVDGKFVNSGEQVAIDGQSVEYESLCGTCYLEFFGSL